MRSLVLACLLLSACTPLKVESVPQVRQHLQLPPIEPVEILPVQWKVLGGAQPYMALTPADYANLAIDLEAVKAYIELLHTRLEAYRTYYESPSESPSK